MWGLRGAWLLAVAALAVPCGWVGAQPVAAQLSAAIVPAPATCQGREVTIRGTDQRDVLTGTAGRDVVAGGNGSDVITGLGGRDLLCGGRGRDRMNGGPGADQIYGGRDGVRQIDVVFFVGDVLDGGPGNDVLDGGIDRGADVLTYAAAPAPVGVDARLGLASTGVSTDRFRGFDTIVGSPLDDLMVGGPAGPPDDRPLSLEGDAGNDTIRGNGIQALGGPGDDRVRVRDSFVEADAGDDTVTVLGPEGSEVRPGSGDDVVTGGPGGDIVDLDFRSTGGIGDGADIVRTGDGRDSVYSAGIGDVIDMGASQDRVLINTGPLTLQAGHGSDFVLLDLFRSGCANQDGDVIRGGTGIDRIEYLRTCAVTANDGVEVSLIDGTASGAAGIDTVLGFENVVGSFAADSITGNDGTNVLSGGDGPDELFGLGGDDRLTGGTGSDLSDGGDGIDTCQAESTIGCE